MLWSMGGIVKVCIINKLWVGHVWLKSHALNVGHKDQCFVNCVIVNLMGAALTDISVLDY
jgi:hypothetical protein